MWVCDPKSAQRVLPDSLLLNFLRRLLITDRDDPYIAAVITSANIVLNPTLDHQIS